MVTDSRGIAVSISRVVTDSRGIAVSISRVVTDTRGIAVSISRISYWSLFRAMRHSHVYVRLVAEKTRKVNIYMVCLENLIYRCRYQTDTPLWIKFILHFCKGKREWKWCPGTSLLCLVPNKYLLDKQVSVWNQYPKKYILSVSV